MRVVIAGGHGKVALLLERLLAEHGDQAVGLEAASAGDVTALLSGADAAVVAAGAGPGSGARVKTPSTGLPPC